MEKTQEIKYFAIELLKRMIMQNRYLQIVEKINYYLFVVAICMLPFPTRISLYAWELWLFSWLLEGRFLRKENLQWHKGIMPIILCVVWVLWELISCTWAINKTDAFNMIVRHLSFVMILPVAVWGVNEQYDLWKAAKYFVISSIASVFIYCAYLYIIQQWGYLYEFHHLPEGVLSLEYFGNNISLTKHRLYYGTVLNLAIVALLQIRIPLLSINRENSISTIFFFLKLVILVIGIILSASRANMLTLLVISAVAIIQPLRGKIRALVASLVGIMVITMCALLFTLHPRFEKLQIEHLTERESYSIAEVEPRINIWYSALQTPTDYLWHGVGAGGNSEYLNPIYSSFNWKHFEERQFNTHNQYLGVLIDLGMFAAVFFLLAWLLFPIWYKGRVRQFAILVVLVIGLNMLTENMLDRIDGVIITCVTLVTISLLSRAQRAK